MTTLLIVLAWVLSVAISWLILRASIKVYGEFIDRVDISIIFLQLIPLLNIAASTGALIAAFSCRFEEDERQFKKKLFLIRDKEE